MCVGTGMARSRQEAALRAQEAAAAELKPGMTILARAKGYPAWPALVVDEADVPESVTSVRPNKKVVVPVLFYNDNTFLWLSPTEAEYLSTESALKASKSKVKKQLKEAYAIASNPPPYEEILGSLNDEEDKQGTKNENEDEAETMEVEQVADSDPVASEDVKPEVGGRSKPRRARSAAERALEMPVPRAKRAKISNGTASRSTPNGHQTRGAASASGAGDDDNDSEYVDTGSTETGNETGTDAVVTETESEYSEKTLANSQSARFDLCSETRQVLQETLLRDQSASESEYTRCSELVQRVLNVPMEISVLRRSKLSRVVLAALQTELPTPLKTELEELAALWTTASEPIVRGIPEHLAPAEDPTRENTEEPQSEPQSEAQSEAPSEPQSKATSEVPSEAPSEAPSEPQLEPQSEPQSELQTEPPAEPQPEPEAESRADSELKEAESQVEHQSAPAEAPAEESMEASAVAPVEAPAVAPTVTPTEATEATEAQPKAPETTSEVPAASSEVPNEQDPSK